MVIFGVELQRVAKGWRGGGEHRGSRDFSSSQREPLLFYRAVLFCTVLISSTTPALLRGSQARGGGILYINYVHIRGAKSQNIFIQTKQSTLL